MMHSLYAVADVGGGLELVKLYVEEMNGPNAADTTKRVYQLQNIENQRLDAKGSGKALAQSYTTADVKTVAELFEVVKSRIRSSLLGFCSTVSLCSESLETKVLKSKPARGMMKVLTRKEAGPMPEQMTLDAYKKKVRDCLRATLREDTVSQRMKLHEAELQECFEENWSPAGTAAGIASGLL